MYAVFNQESVMAVIGSSKANKDRKQRENSQKKKSESLFDRVLRNAINEEVAPAQFNAMVYGRDGRAQTIHYQTREYHY